MPRLKTIKIAALNIKTQPHTPKKYKALFKNTFNLETSKKIFGDNWGMIGSCNSNDNIVTGSIYKFLNIDPYGAWLNLKDRTPIDPEKDSVVTVPEYLKPNLKQISYIFYLKKHRFFFDKEFMTPRSMKKLIIALFSEEIIVKQFGQVDVEIESTREAITKTLAIPRITKLDINFTMPNDDTLSEIEEDVIERFKRQRIRKFKQTTTSTDEDGFEADDETKALMNIARSNGKVTATGYQDDQKIICSTEDHPMIEPITYDPEREIPLQAMIQASTALLARINR